MSKEFVKGNIYVFTKKKFMAAKDRAGIKNVGDWVNKANGNVVTVEGKISGKCRSYGVVPRWCKCISNNHIEPEKPMSAEEISSLDDALCEHCRCTEYGLSMGAQHGSGVSIGCEGNWC